MKRVEAEAIGSVADYRLVERSIPAPGADEVLLRVAACGMGYVDALVALGGYQVKPPLPFTPGQEVAGTVAAIGANISGVRVGDRMLAGGFGGGLSEYLTVAASDALAIPDAMSFAQAAVFRINYLTALHALRDRGAIAPGETLLVLGAAGGLLAVSGVLAVGVVLAGTTGRRICN